YEVLMHRAWRQDLSATDTRVAIHDGEPQLGQYPVHGTLRLRLDRLVEMQAELWVNQLEDGQIVQSEQIRQNRRLKPGELTFVDGTSLGLLVRATPQSSGGSLARAEWPTQRAGHHVASVQSAAAA